MVQDVVKYTIAGSLFTGAIIALFIFLGNLIGHLIKNNSQVSKSALRWLLIIFVGLMSLTILISLIILLTPTDLHIFGDIIRWVSGIF